MGWDTAANIISDAALGLGLVSAAIADPWASTDANVVQLRLLLKELGRDLVLERDWTHLQKEHTFSTAAGTPTYDLPADFAEMINQTGWDRTNRLPLGGPLSPQEWQYLSGTAAGQLVTVMFRPGDGVMRVYPDTNVPNAHSIAFEYRSTYWVKPNEQTTGTDDEPTANSDTLLFDSQLLVLGLRLAFLASKGFDVTAAQNAYDARLAKVTDADSPAPVLSINRRGFMEPLIGGRNIPPTGFGS